MKKISIISFVLLSLPNLVEARNKHKTNFDVPPKVQRSSINHLDTSSLPEHSGNYTLDNSHYTSTRKNTSNMLAPKKRAANNKELKQPQTTQHISPRKNSESEQQNAPTELLNFVFSTPWRDPRYRKKLFKNDGNRGNRCRATNNYSGKSYKKQKKHS